MSFVGNDGGDSEHRFQDSAVCSMGRGDSYRMDPSSSQQGLELIEGSLDEFTEPLPKCRRMSITDGNQSSKNEADTTV